MATLHWNRPPRPQPTAGPAPTEPTAVVLVDTATPTLSTLPPAPNALWAPVSMLEQNPELDPNTVIEVLKLLAQGYSVREIRETYPIGHDEIQRWRATDWWGTLMAEASAEVHGEDLRSAQNAIRQALATGDATTARWYLERRDPETFAPRAATKIDLTVADRAGGGAGRLYGNGQPDSAASDKDRQAALAAEKEAAALREAAVRSLFLTMGGAAEDPTEQDAIDVAPADFYSSP